MTGPCCGLWGWLFGHKFEHFLVSSRPSDLKGMKIDGYGSAEDIVKALSTYTYTVRCKRCGKGAE